MDRREEDVLDEVALNEVTRIAVAVEHLRHLLLAAAKAELQAIRKQAATEPPAR